MSADHPHIPLAVPIALSVVAGYVDGCTFVGLFGLFVAQVTGSFVVAGAQLVLHDKTALVKTLAIPAFFCAGIVATVVIRLASAWRGALIASFILEIVLLGAFTLVAMFAGPLHDPNQPAALLAAILGLCAMGAQSALVRLLFSGFGSTNVMTTNTSQIAIDATDVVLGWRRALHAQEDAHARDRAASARRRLLQNAPLALGFLAGTVAGVLAYAAVGFICLLAAIAAMLVLIVWVIGRPR